MKLCNRKSRKYVWRTWISDGISGSLLLVFLYTAVNKLSNVEAFSMGLKEVPLLKQHSEPVAWAIPIAELSIVLLLFLPATRLWGLFASLTALLFFTGYLLYMIAYAPHLPCSCGGVLNSLGWKEHVLLNLFLLLLNTGALLLYPVYSPGERTPP